jgi:hypothetical protein
MKISRFADEPMALVLGRAEATLAVSEMLLSSWGGGRYGTPEILPLNSGPTE